MKVPGLDAYYGDPPEDEVCGECDDYCASVEDHLKFHPEPDPDCNACLLVALTMVSRKLVELKDENEALRDQIRAVRDVCNEAAHMDFRSTPIKHSVRSLAARIAQILDGDA